MAQGKDILILLIEVIRSGLLITNYGITVKLRACSKNQVTKVTSTLSP